MGELVQCVRLKREAEGLDRQPYPGDLGRRVLENVSKEGWQQWLRHQTMLINEYRLTPIEPKDRKFLEEQAPVLPVLRGVVKKPACYFHHDYARPSIVMLLPELARIRPEAKVPVTKHPQWSYFRNHP
jgi:Fe-S cluster biosynthesis and repair protein YggX